MTPNDLGQKERREIANWARAISEINRKSLEEMIRVGKSAQEAFSHQERIQWRLIQKMQQDVLRYLEGIDAATMSMILDNVQRLEIASFMKAIEASTVAYRDYVEDIQRTYQESMLAEIVETSRMLSLAHANTILSYRAFIESKPEVRVKLSEEQKPVQEKVEQDIGSLLGRLDPNYVTMWVGAWTTFNTKSPDHLRQSVASVRELLNHVLRKLSPGNITRKDRIRSIVSGNGNQAAEADFIESVADYIDKLYAILSKICHSVYKDELCVKMALKGTEAVLVVLLRRGEDISTETNP